MPLKVMNGVLVEFTVLLNLIRYLLGRCVTSFEWNPTNQDLVAVGYGKFYFAETSTGMVMIWNIKNPVQPERVYNFLNPVTTLSFSTKVSFSAATFNSCWRDSLLENK